MYLFFGRLYFLVIYFCIVFANYYEDVGEEDPEEYYYEYDSDAEEAENVNLEIDKQFGNFVGSNLFPERGYLKTCFSLEDVALLAARKEFEVSQYIFIFLFLF